MTDYTVAVLEDAIHILRVVRDHPEGLTLAQITGRTGMVKNKIFRILYTFEKQNMVRRDARGLYHLGADLLDFGQQVQSQTILLEVSRAVMDRLVVETGESIFLGVVNGCDALCIAMRESSHSIRLFAQVGRRAPLHSGGVPKVLFAFLPEAERARMLDTLIGKGADAQAERAALTRRLDQIRREGYAIVEDELDVGAHSVAAPIHNHRGQVVAAISIAGPTHRFPPERVRQYVDLILEAAQEISRAMGYQNPARQKNGMILPGLF